MGPNKIIYGYTYGVLHFQCANWRNLLIKQAWYRCLEHIKNPQKSIGIINQLYAPSKDEKGLYCATCPADWFLNYHFFDAQVYNQPEYWKEKEIYTWFATYGLLFFKDLDIWDIDWQLEHC